MRNAGLEETQARIKIARRNINNLRYADVTFYIMNSSMIWAPKRKQMVEEVLVSFWRNEDAKKSDKNEDAFL